MPNCDCGNDECTGLTPENFDYKLLDYSIRILTKAGIIKDGEVVI